MPRKLVVRQLRANSYYHVYNQGVSKKEIFLDKEDYEKFLFYLRIYTVPTAELGTRFLKLSPRLESKNLSSEINILAFCLMPDHFHLVVKQESKEVLPKLLKQLANAYTTYFNGKYRRAGSLFDGRYRAAIIASEFLILPLVRFVHLNPVVAGFVGDPRAYPWSSVNDHTDSNELLNRFGGIEKWDEFHLDRGDYENSKEKIRAVMID